MHDTRALFRCRACGGIFVCLILQRIGTAQVFLEPYLSTGGGPNNATLTLLLLIYRYAFASSTGRAYGSATALSLMLAVGLGVLSVAYLRLTSRWGTA